MSDEITNALKLRHRGYYVIPSGETRPAPVVPNPHPSLSPIPSRVDRENARRFLKLKLGLQVPGGDDGND